MRATHCYMRVLIWTWCDSMTWWWRENVCMRPWELKLEMVVNLGDSLKLEHAIVLFPAPIFGITIHHQRGWVGLYSAYPHQGWKWVYTLGIPSRLKDIIVIYPAPIYGITIHHQHGREGLYTVLMHTRAGNGYTPWKFLQNWRIPQ